MKIKFLKKSMVLLTLSSFISISAHAGLIDMGTTTLDDNTGLEWLDLTETNGMSNDDVRAEFVQGGSLEGYRYASLLEVEGFLTAAGGTGPHYLYQDNGNIPLNGWVTDLLALWGATSGTNAFNVTSYVMFGDVVRDTYMVDIDTDRGELRPNGEICDDPHQFTCFDSIEVVGEQAEVGLLQDFYIGGYSTVRFGIDHFQRRSVDVGHVAYGSAIVKADVPEPSTFAIFALGMIGLASRRFKKQS
jgi:hypothetical protein